MFKNTIKTLLAVGVIATGATLSTGGSANAGSVGVYFSNGHGGLFISGGHGPRQCTQGSSSPSCYAPPDAH